MSEKSKKKADVVEAKVEDVKSVEQPSPVQSSATPANATKSNNKTALIVVVVILALCCCLCVVGLLVSTVLPALGFATFMNSNVLPTDSSVDTILDNALNNLKDPSMDDLLNLWGRAEVPANFPSDIPMYQGAEPYMVYRGDANTVSVNFLVKANVSEIESFFESELIDNGWEINNSGMFEGSGALFGVKGDRTITVAYQSYDTYSSISIIY